MAFDGLLGGKLGYGVFRSLCHASGENEAAVTRHSSDPRLQREFGSDFRRHVSDKLVLDFGCGYGQVVVEAAEMGARAVIGTDIREDVLNEGRAGAAQAKVADKCIFLNSKDPAVLLPYHGKVEVIISLDAFEHYTNPDGVLSEMWNLLCPGGSVFISFGPPWWHPYGCHMMFMDAPPWSHLLFKEDTIMAVRSLYRTDGARHFEDVEGGLNRMTIRRFEKLVQHSGFRLLVLRCVPIKGTSLLAGNRWGREFFTSLVKAQLVKV